MSVRLAERARELGPRDRRPAPGGLHAHGQGRGGRGGLRGGGDRQVDRVRGRRRPGGLRRLRAPPNRHRQAGRRARRGRGAPGRRRRGARRHRLRHRRRAALRPRPAGPVRRVAARARARLGGRRRPPQPVLRSIRASWPAAWTRAWWRWATTAPSRRYKPRPRESCTGGRKTRPAAALDASRSWRLRSTGTPMPAIETVWVMVAAILVMFMQVGFLFLEVGFSRMKNVGHDRPEGAGQLLDRGALLLGGRLRARLRRHGLVRGHGGLLPGHDERRPLPRHGLLGGRGAGQVLLPVRLLRRLARDRLGHDPRADQVRRLPHLRGRSSAR